ncbi:MAG: hypothetical protein KC468_06735 [Myxococcales bacterium]|nr:hypothetical protein [Myxococcales bacterium]
MPCSSRCKKPGKAACWARTRGPESTKVPTMGRRRPGLTLIGISHSPTLGM